MINCSKGHFSALLATPAKVNLSLRIVGRRPDGYHDLISVFEPLTLADCLSCSFISGPLPLLLTLDCPQLPDLSPEDNLVLKAAQRMAEKAAAAGRKLSGGWHFFLDKRIPQGAGLGGGSGNAAAVINLFNDFYGLELGVEERRRLAAGLGADVPFFIEPVPSLVEGIGDRLTSLEKQRNSRRYYLLIKPPFGVATAWAYGALDQAAIASAEIDRDQFLASVFDCDLVNDFEGPVMKAFPELAELKSWLAGCPGCAASLMSGSGSCVYGVFQDFAKARTAAAKARENWPRQGYEIILAQNLG